jgi:hypothetical protein
MEFEGVHVKACDSHSEFQPEANYLENFLALCKRGRERLNLKMTYCIVGVAAPARESPRYEFDAGLNKSK